MAVSQATTVMQLALTALVRVLWLCLVALAVMADASPRQFRVPTTGSQRYESHALAWQKQKLMLYISVDRIGWAAPGSGRKG
jgi:hypothetical protein